MAGKAQVLWRFLVSDIRKPQSSPIDFYVRSSTVDRAVERMEVFKKKFKNYYSVLSDTPTLARQYTGWLDDDSTSTGFNCFSTMTRVPK